MTRAALESGAIRKRWRILGFTGRMVDQGGVRGMGREYDVECIDCGGKRTMTPVQIHNRVCRCAPRRSRARRGPYRCTVCRGDDHNARVCPERERDPRDFDPDLPWHRDVETRVLVRLWGEMTLQTVGDLWDLSRERIRQLEERALAKLARRAKANPRDAAAIRELLAACAQRRETAAEQAQREAPALRGRQSWQGDDEEPEEQCA